MRVCTQCNTENDDNAKFCVNCGAKMAEQQPEQAAPSQEQAAPSQEQPQMNQQTGQSSSQQTQFHQGTTQNNGNQYYQYQQPPVDIYDHTAEFDPRDISANKVICMVAYLLGTMGVIIAMLAANKSAYTAFHVRQALKFVVLDWLIGFCAVLLCWTFIVPIAAGILYLVLLVVKIICFFSICSGKAKEPAIIRSFGFLR